MAVAGVGAGSSVAARCRAARVAVVRVTVIGEDTRRQVMVYSVAGIVARPEGVGAIPFEGGRCHSRDGEEVNSSEMHREEV